jgi:hypothetical protein
MTQLLRKVGSSDSGVEWVSVTVLSPYKELSRGQFFPRTRKKDGLRDCSTLVSPPAGILVGLDVTTREEAEARKKAEA